MNNHIQQKKISTQQDTLGEKKNEMNKNQKKNIEVKNETYGKGTLFDVKHYDVLNQIVKQKENK